MAVLQKSTKQIIQTAAKADGIDLQTIAAAIAVLEGRRLSMEASKPLVVNQAEAARLLCVSRFTIRKLVAHGRIRPVQLLDCVRYPISELERLVTP